MMKMVRFFVLILLALCSSDLFAVNSNLPCIPDAKKHTCKLSGQQIDPREYVLWGNGECHEPYDKYVLLDDDEGRCTAQYVASDLILTAAHCVLNDETQKLQKVKFRFLNCEGQYFTAEAIKIGNIQKYYNDTGRWSEKSVPYDWVILHVTDKGLYNKNTFSVPDEKMIQDVASRQGAYIVDNAGFGGLPILSDGQLRIIKDKVRARCSSLTEQGAMFACFKQVWNELPWARNDTSRLKIHKECRLWPYFRGIVKNPDDTIHKFEGLFHYTKCYSWAGNSGGAYSYSGSDTLLGIVSGGNHSAPDKNSKIGFVVPTRVINKVVHDLRPNLTVKIRKFIADLKAEKLQKDNSIILTDTKIDKTYFDKMPSNQLDISQEIADKDIDTENEAGNTNNADIIAEKMQETQQVLENWLQQLDSLSDEEVLMMAEQMSEYEILQEQYEAARSRERSTSNKILGAAAMGVTGIGGMQLASGLAEQSADDAAERDMRAYLATFMCDYGAGRNIRGGTTNIALPVATDMLPMVNEYKQLALDLKSRKEALNMLPGIESDLVLNAADAGLYDNVSIGKTDGAFTSLSRALLDDSSDDAAKWSEQKSGAESKTKMGTGLTISGAAGGAIGNLIINNSQKKSDFRSEKYIAE